jgi:hypothetical protein
LFQFRINGIDYKHFIDSALFNAEKGINISILYHSSVNKEIPYPTTYLIFMIMKPNQSRREFLVKSSKAGLACGVLACCPKLLSYGAWLPEGEIPDPKKLNYCGYTCPADCQMKVATDTNDIEKKKQAYIDWHFEDKYGIAFDPDKVVCYGCKTTEQNPGIGVEKCTVRNCAIERGYDCCIECPGLTACDKEIWKTYPDFHKAVIEMQKTYQKGAVS